MISPPNLPELEFSEDRLPVMEERKPLPVNLWNRMTLVLAVITILIAAIFLWIFIDPQAIINPFPPVKIPAAVIIPTQTPQPSPTQTGIPSQTPLPSKTPLPTNTSAPTETPLPPTATITPVTLAAEAGTLMPSPRVTESAYQFIVQPGNPVAIASTIMRPEEGCKWMGVGGQVVDMQDAPIVGLRVQLYGSLHGKIKAITSLTGTVNRYGPAGYEITISDYPTETNRSLWLQLFNQAGGTLSDKIFLDTYASCEQNLIMINFKQVK